MPIIHLTCRERELIIESSEISFSSNHEEGIGNDVVTFGEIISVKSDFESVQYMLDPEDESVIVMVRKIRDIVLGGENPIAGAMIRFVEDDDGMPVIGEIPVDESEAFPVNVDRDGSYGLLFVR